MVAVEAIEAMGFSREGKIVANLLDRSEPFIIDTPLIDPEDCEY